MGLRPSLRANLLTLSRRFNQVFYKLLYLNYE